eukprot:TRINITY_DN16792_c0_g1_i1.p1 TRINITY_DN16792_c0_g1~~TRINITY_DN16792_c0_g1_i1.p1  ORF type:complete len:262 (+),score=47.82 TRINITY_DN16792_c0_g1_i1:120-905(+)
MFFRKKFCPSFKLIDIEKGLEKILKKNEIDSFLIKQFTFIDRYLNNNNNDICNKHLNDMIVKEFGYSVIKKQSRYKEAEKGVFLIGEGATKGDIVGIYPGLVYYPGDSVMFTSFRNNYFLRRRDGSSVDGKYDGLSKWFYSSVSKRNDLSNEIKLCDDSWIDFSLNKELYSRNPLATGHLINHAQNEEANVMYFEHDYQLSNYNIGIRKYIPNIPYNNNYINTKSLNTIVMVALRDIENGEELYSNYNFIGYNFDDNHQCK